MSGADAGRSTLASLQSVVRVVLAAAFAALFLLVGASPGEWGLPFGVAMAAFSGYWFLREPIEDHLTGPQEWALFGLAGVLLLSDVVVAGGEITAGVVLGGVAFLGVAGLFGYRAVRRRSSRERE